MDDYNSWKNFLFPKDKESNFDKIHPLFLLQFNHIHEIWLFKLTPRKQVCQFSKYVVWKQTTEVDSALNI